MALFYDDLIITTLRPVPLLMREGHCRAYPLEQSSDFGAWPR